MSRYSSYGRLDDQVLQDIDLGFAGFNDRLRPDQLLPGMLEKCENARLDRNGEWKLRSGYDLQLAPLAVGDTALKLPFNVFADKTITSSNHETVDATTFKLTETSHGLSVGTIVDISGVTVSTGTAPNGTFKVKAVTSNTFSVAVTGLTDSAPGGTATVISPSLRDGDINVVYGSCSFIDPNSIDQEGYIILAGNTKAVAVKTSDPSTSYDLGYSGETVGDLCNVIQAFNKIYIFRKGGSVGKPALVLDTAENNINTSPSFSLVSNGSYTQPIEFAVSAGQFAMVENIGVVHSNPDLYKQGQIITLIGDLDTQKTGIKLGTNMTVAKVFTQGSTIAIKTDGTGVVNGGTSHGNAEFASFYKITITTSSNHNLKVGDPIEIDGVDTSHLDGDRYVSEVVDGDTFVVYVSGNVNPTLSTPTVRLAAGFNFFIPSGSLESHTLEKLSLDCQPVFSRKVASSLGYIHMPCPEFGTLHQGRLIVPYQYDPEDNNNARKIYDEIIASDILDSDTYDRIFGSFRFNAGTSDFTVGITSFSEDSILVFNKNSIHRVSGTTDPTTATAQVLTEEIGALARKSITQVGKNVFFLSDNGVYSLEFLDEYNLRGTQTPLSEPIAKTMDRLFNTESKDHAHRAVGLYFNNRYYLAVPFDGNDYNSHLLIYNFLNNNWESVDAPTTDGKFEYTNLLLSNDEVYAVNTDGGIHKVDGKQIGFSNVSQQGKDTTVTQIEASSQETNIDGVLKTRMYTMSDIGRKKFREFSLSAEGGVNISSNMSIKLQTENVDLELGASQSDLGTITNYLGKSIPPEEDINIRGRIGNRRAYGAQFQLENTEGSPRVKNIKVTATKTFNSLNPTE